MSFSETSFLHPNPNGWYVIERGDQLKKGQIIHKKFAGKDIVVFRLEDGQACASTAFCQTAVGCCRSCRPLSFSLLFVVSAVGWRF